MSVRLSAVRVCLRRSEERSGTAARLAGGQLRRLSPRGRCPGSGRPRRRQPRSGSVTAGEDGPPAAELSAPDALRPALTSGDASGTRDAAVQPSAAARRR